MEWHKANKPSMAIVKHKFLHFIQKENNKQKVFNRIGDCLDRLLLSKTNLGLIRAYLTLLKEHK